MHSPSARTRYSDVDDGLITTENAEEINEFPQEPEYQYQLAGVPKKPPAMLKVAEDAEQITDGVAIAESALTEKVLTVIVILTHEVELQIFSALTKYLS